MPSSSANLICLTHGNSYLFSYNISGHIITSLYNPGLNISAASFLRIVSPELGHEPFVLSENCEEVSSIGIINLATVTDATIGQCARMLQHI